MGTLQTINTNGTDEMVVIPRAQYERLISDLEDAQDIASAKEFE